MRNLNRDSRLPLLSPGTVIRDIDAIDQWLGAGQFSDVSQVRHRFMGLQEMTIHSQLTDQWGHYVETWGSRIEGDQ